MSSSVARSTAPAPLGNHRSAGTIGSTGWFLISATLLRSRLSVDEIIHHYEVVRRSVIPVAEVSRGAAKSTFAGSDLHSGDYLRVERYAYE